MGAVATFRDLSDMMELAEELTGAKKWIEALRVRAHNYRNTLHVINGLVKNQQYPSSSATSKSCALPMKFITAALPA